MDRWGPIKLLVSPFEIEIFGRIQVAIDKIRSTFCEIATGNVAAAFDGKMKKYPSTQS